MPKLQSKPPVVTITQNPSDLDLVSPKETAKILGTSVGTLAKWRCTKKPPLPYIKVSRTVMYLREDLRQFIASRRVEVRAI